jgi:hypothetical protein
MLIFGLVFLVGGLVLSLLIARRGRKDKGKEIESEDS